MSKINDRTALLPSFKIKEFSELKEYTNNLLDIYKKVENEVPDMLFVIQSKRNKDGTYTVFMCATPENNLKQIKFHGNIASIDKLLVERK